MQIHSKCKIPKCKLVERRNNFSNFYSKKHISKIIHFLQNSIYQIFNPILPYVFTLVFQFVQNRKIDDNPLAISFWPIYRPLPKYICLRHLQMLLNTTGDHKLDCITRLTGRGPSGELGPNLIYGPNNRPLNRQNILIIPDMNHWNFRQKIMVFILCLVRIYNSLNNLPSKTD